MPRKGQHLSAEAKAKIGAATRGHTVTAEQREKLRSLHMGTHHSPETRAKMSATRKGRPMPEEQKALRRGPHPGRSNGWKGKHHTEEQKAKMSAANKGQTVTPEQRAAISAAQKGRKPSLETRKKIASSMLGNKYAAGYHHSLEARAKIAAAMTISAVKRIAAGLFGPPKNGFRHPSERAVGEWLTAQGWDWKYEERGYLVEGGHKYWPDFHVYGRTGKLTRIIEVKSYKYSTMEGKAKLFWEMYQWLPFEVWDGPKLKQLGIL